MKKDVILKMRSVQTVNGESSETELLTDGVFSIAKGVCTVRYSESEATGFEGSDTELSCTGDALASIKRSGSFNSHLMLETGKKHYCHYNTPFGDMVVGITTNSIKNSLGSQGGSVYLNYSVDINSSFLSDNEIFIDISLSGKDRTSGKECS